jgi:hypothetical protein
MNRSAATGKPRSVAAEARNAGTLATSTPRRARFSTTADDARQRIPTGRVALPCRPVQPEIEVLGRRWGAWIIFAAADRGGMEARPKSARRVAGPAGTAVPASRRPTARLTENRRSANRSRLIFELATATAVPNLVSVMLRHAGFFFVSLLLIFSVTGRNGGRGGVCLPVPTPAASCGCCSGCVTVSCCPAPASTPKFPAAPVRAAAAEDAAWLALFSHAAPALDAPAPRPLPPAVSAAPRVPAVPLFLSGGGLLR